MQIEVTTRTGTIYVLANGRMTRLPVDPWGHGPLIEDGAFKLHRPLSIGTPLHAYVYGTGNILTTPITSIVENWDDGTGRHDRSA